MSKEKEEKVEKPFDGIAPVGETVLVVRPKAMNDVYVGVITDSFNEGVIEVYVLPGKGFSRPETFSAMRHRSDPILWDEDNPGQPSRFAIDNGYWFFRKEKK